MDTRKPLPEKVDYELNIVRDDGNIEKIIIDEVIGMGGSCIAYKGRWRSLSNHPVIIKECFPKSERISRSKNCNSIEIKDEGYFDKEKRRFMRGITLADKFYSSEKLKDLFWYGSCNNTIYGVSLQGNARLLTDIAKTDHLSIMQIANIMKSLCEVIGNIHKSHRLYLDCKPDNILCDKEGHVQLFDFDTVVGIEDIKRRNYEACSYSMGWAAPEQLPNDINLYSNDISYKTDIFAIGAVFFWLLTGKKPYDYEIKSLFASIESNQFDWRGKSGICKNADKVVINTIHKIVRKTLCYDSNQRIGDTNYLAELFEQLGETSSIENSTNRHIKAVKPNNLNRFAYDSNIVPFIGRKNEINELIQMCEDNADVSWIGVCGLPGSGKSRLVYEFGLIMENQEWDVIRITHLKSSYSKIYRQTENIRRDTLICIENANQNEKEIEDLILSCIDVWANSGCKIRFVLVDRKSEDLLFNSYDVMSYRYSINEDLVDCDQGSICLSQLSPQETKLLMRLFAERLYHSELREDIILRLYGEYVNLGGMTLNALFITDAWCNGGDITKIDEKDALIYILMTEYERIRSTASLLSTSVVSIENNIKAAKLVVALSYLITDLTLEKCMTLISELYDASVNNEALAWILKQLNYLNEKNIIERTLSNIVIEYLTIDVINSYETDDAKVILEFVLKENDSFSFLLTCLQMISNYREESIGSTNIGRFIHAALYKNNFKRFIPKDSWINYLLDLNTLRQENLGSSLAVIKKINNAEVHLKDYLENMYPKEAKLLWDNIDDALIDYENYLDLSHDERKKKIQVGSLSALLAEGMNDLRFWIGFYIPANIVFNREECKLDFLRFHYNDTIYMYQATYTGECSFSFGSGHGKIEYFDNCVYEGEVFITRPNGKGKLVDSSGNIYEGFFLNGLFSGEGTMTYASGKKYTGMWRDGKPYETEKNGLIECDNSEISTNDGQDIVDNNTPWGPERTLFTNSNPAPYPTFNSITDNAILGDERYFVRIIEVGSKHQYKKTIQIEADKQYEVHIFYRNDADFSLNKRDHDYLGVARDVRVMSYFPDNLLAGETGLVYGKITASNSNPEEVWDTVRLIARDDVELKYLLASAKIYNSWDKRGTLLSTNLFSDTGTFIGLNELNGVILAGDEFSGHVVYTIVTNKYNDSINDNGLKLATKAGGWGPERALFTNSNPAPYPTFNSITDNAAVGDERDFVRIVEVGTGGVYSNKVKIREGHEYQVLIYYQNDATTKNDYATGVFVSAFYPTIIKPKRLYSVDAVIKADNTMPPKVWDGAFLYSDEELKLSIKNNSAKIYNDGKLNGELLPETLFSYEGLQIGVDCYDGIIPADSGLKSSGRIVYTLVATKVECDDSTCGG